MAGGGGGGGGGGDGGGGGRGWLRVSLATLWGTGYKGTLKGVDGWGGYGMGACVVVGVEGVESVVGMEGVVGKCPFNCSKVYLV